jgi:hypothetical protein
LKIAVTSVTSACSAGTRDNGSAQRTSLRAKRPDTADIDPNKPPITIDWQSPKHHLLTMHYCFEIAHAEIETARVWASKNDFGALGRRGAASLSTTWRATKIIPIGRETSWP